MEADIISNLQAIDMAHSNTSRLQLAASVVVWHALVTVTSLLPHTAQAQNRLSEGCPMTFSIVDMGVWETDDAGEFARSFGGLLVDIGRQDMAQPDTENAWVTCYPTSYSAGQRQYKDGIQIPLVSHVVRPTGLGFAQYESTEKVFENLDVLFQSHFSDRPVFEMLFSDELGAGLCKLGDEIDHGSVFRDYACLISIGSGSEARLFFYCQANPHSCGYYFSLEDGVMAYQQPSDYQFTRRANTLKDAARAWIDFALSGQKEIEERRITRDQFIILNEE